MTRYSTNYKYNALDSLKTKVSVQRGWAWGVMIIGALLAFEIFNYSTTDFALNDLLGNLTFVGIRWSTILALAFCGIDFAGIARLFTPEEGANEPKEIWYLLGAWVLGATMNAMLTWWGVSIAILNNHTLGNAVIDRVTLLKIVPIFVAAMVWLSRILIIGTFSVAGERLFSQADTSPVKSYKKNQYSQPKSRSNSTYKNNNTKQRQQPSYQRQPAFRSAAPKPKPVSRPSSIYGNEEEQTYSRSEPSYHPVSARSNNQTNNSNYQGGNNKNRNNGNGYY
jgi:hypothetical protein